MIVIVNIDGPRVLRLLTDDGMVPQEAGRRIAHSIAHGAYVSKRHIIIRDTDTDLYVLIIR
jgi:hypothetical protein